jgi:hypothetical protein
MKPRVSVAVKHGDNVRAQGPSVHVSVAEGDEGTAEDGRGHMCLCGMSYRHGGTWREGRLTDHCSPMRWRR